MFLPKNLSQKYQKLIDKDNLSKPNTQKKMGEGKNKPKIGKLPQVYGVDYGKFYSSILIVLQKRKTFFLLLE